MKCEKCGFYYEGSRVCPNCGEVASGEADKVTDATTQQKPLGNPTPVLVFGILALAFALELPPLGIIFGIIGLVKAKNYFSFAGYPGAGQARAGKKLATAGLIVGIVMTVVLTAVILILAAHVNSHPEILQEIEEAVENAYTL